MRRYVLPLALLILCLPVLAQEPAGLAPSTGLVIEAPQTVLRDTFAVIKVATTGKYTILRARRSLSQPDLPLYIGKADLEWAFVAPPGTYYLEASTVLEDGIHVAAATLVVEDGTPGPGPGPGPGPRPDPVIPDDPWKVGQLTFRLASELTGDASRKCAPLAIAYLDVAKKLESAEIITLTAASQTIQAARKQILAGVEPQWQPVLDEIAKIWNGAWPMTKEEVIAFYRAVAAGLDAVAIVQGGAS